MIKRKNKVIGLCCILFATFMFVGCSNKTVNTQEKTETQTENSNTDVTDNNKEATEIEESIYSKETNPVVTFNIEGYGTIKAELYPDLAPNTVENFIELANSGFYNGLTFHRIVNNFVIQGGDPTGTGMGDAGYNIKGEFASNGVDNKLSHDVGVLSMARAMDNDSASSQFFIVTGKATNLDGEYAGFGKIIEGLDIIDKIDDVEVDIDDMPVNKIVMKSVTVDTKGITYESADKLK